MMYGSPFYGGIVPYAYPTPSAAALPGSNNTVKDDKAATQALQATGGATNGSGAVSVPPRLRLTQAFALARSLVGFEKSSS